MVSASPPIAVAPAPEVDPLFVSSASALDGLVAELEGDVRPGRAAPDVLVRRREEQRAMPWQGVADGVAVRRTGRDGTLVCEVPEPRGTVLYLHGGGHRFGSAMLGVPFASRICAAASVNVVCAEFRLAPEHPFPAALVDVLRLYGSMDAPPVVLGDSSGGGLAMSLCLGCREAGAPMPPKMVLLSPWADLRCGAETYDTRADRDILFSKAAALDAAEMYAQGFDVEHPLMSPLLGDLAVFPPTLLFAAAEEVLLGDSLATAKGLVEAGVPLELIVEPGVQHVWPVIWPELPQSARALRRIAAFLAAE